MPASFPTQYLKATDFGFSLPGTAVVDGIEVLVERRSSAGSVLDAAARIVKGGVVGASDRSMGGTWSTSDTVVTYGSNSDLWGETMDREPTSTPRASASRSPSTTASTRRGVDQIRIKVYYSVCGDSQIGLSEDCDDGGVANGDCCDSLCNFEAIGKPRATTTRSLCTIDQCDGAGTCDHGAPTTCKQATKSSS